MAVNPAAARTSSPARGIRVGAGGPEGAAGAVAEGLEFWGADSWGAEPCCRALVLGAVTLSTQPAISHRVGVPAEPGSGGTPLGPCPQYLSCRSKPAASTAEGEPGQLTRPGRTLQGAGENLRERPAPQPGPEPARGVLAALGQRNVGEPRVLPREAPRRLAVPREIHDRQRDAQCALRSRWVGMPGSVSRARLRCVNSKDRAYDAPSGDSHPDDVHLVDRNASTTRPAKFLVVLIKKKGAPALVPAQ